MRKLKDLESQARRSAMPWYLRWLVYGSQWWHRDEG